jgi:hypothetical protein
MTLCNRPNQIIRLFGWMIFASAACLAVASVAQEGDVSVAYRSTKEKSKLREGARLVDKEGTFSERGGRHFFTVAGEPEPYTMLENQTLERVTSASTTTEDGQKWVVSALVTEYNNAKFLLLERAVLRPTQSGKPKN